MTSRRARLERRRGAVIVLFVIVLIALCACLALAIDLGVMAVSRAQVQNAADSASMAGVRQLTGDTSNSSDLNNRNEANPAAQKAVAANTFLGTNFNTTDVSGSTGYTSGVLVGKYYYDNTAGKFVCYFPDDTTQNDTGASAANSASENFTAVQALVTRNNSQTYFANVLGITSYNTSATARAVHRPRDLGLVVDFSGSMLFGSLQGLASDNGCFNDRVKSNNPDSNQPNFGHYTAINSSMQSTTSQWVYNPYVIDPSNITQSVTLNKNRAPICADFFSNSAGGPAATAFTAQSTTYATAPGGDVPLSGMKTVRDITGGTSYDSGFETSGSKGYTSAPQGYTLGPNYWGKSFWIWPPIPSGRGNITLTGGATVPADWRKAYFLKSDGTTALDDNTLLFDSNGNVRPPKSGATTNYKINYQNILKWLNTDPKPFPSQLRSGRICYYSSIPSGTDSTLNTRWWAAGGATTLGTLTTVGGSDEQFWKDYIDYALGFSQYPSTTWTNMHCTGNSIGSGSTTSGFALAGYGADVSWNDTTNTTTIYSKPTGSGNQPYMDYRDNPKRPQTLMWFGPQSMIDFMGNYAWATTVGYGRGFMWPGTCHECVTYVCKLGLQGALNDCKTNHPNDSVTMGYYSTPMASLNDGGRFNRICVPMGRQYQNLIDSLWYPPTTIQNTGTEINPYDFNNNQQVPRGGGSTCYSMGLMLIYNQFSCNATSNLQTYSGSSGWQLGESGGLGRLGAQKIVLLESDGFPNYSASKSPVAPSGTGKQDGYYPIRWDSSNGGRCEFPTGLGGADNSTTIATQLVTDYTTTRRPALIFCVGFGPVFDPANSGLSGYATANSALTNLQTLSGITSPIQTVYGTDAAMQTSLQNAITAILQSEVPVSLIK